MLATGILCEVRPRHVRRAPSLLLIMVSEGAPGLKKKKKKKMRTRTNSFWGKYKLD